MNPPVNMNEPPKFDGVMNSVPQVDPGNYDIEAGLYVGYRWRFKLNEDDTLDWVADQLHQDDESDFILGNVRGVTNFIARLQTAEHAADLKAAKEFEVVIYDTPVVQDAFSAVIRFARDDYDSLYQLFHCLLVGYGAPISLKGHLASASKATVDSLIKSFIKEARAFFDFSDIKTFMSSFEVAQANILEEVRRKTGGPA